MDKKSFITLGPESFQFPQCQKRLLTLNGLANQSEQMVIVGAVVQHFPA